MTNLDLSSSSHSPNSHPVRAPRKNLLLAANIEAGALCAPVRIRNLSETGALIDGTALPDVGIALTLRRLDIEIGATVVWRMAGRCGIRFAGTIAVDDWAIGKLPSAVVYQSSQAGVDARLAAIRSGTALSSDGEHAPPATALSADALAARIAEELADVQCALDTAGEALSDDPMVLQQHGGALQHIDVASQILAELGALLRSKDRVSALAAVNMHDLRVRLSRT